MSKYMLCLLLVVALASVLLVEAKPITDADPGDAFWIAVYGDPNEERPPFHWSGFTHVIKPDGTILLTPTRKEKNTYNFPL